MTKTFEAEPVLAFEPRKPGTRRSYTAEQKRVILEEAQRPGASISAVARQFGISPSLVFHWKRQMDAGGQKALEVGEAVVAESEAKMLRAKVRELERLLGKKTMENEILKEAVEIARAKNGCRAAPPRAGKVDSERGCTSARLLTPASLGPSTAERAARLFQGLGG